MTPPQVQNCPASIVERSNSLQKDIFWTEPTFTDNVEVATIQSNRQPGFSMQTYTSLTVQYTASDAAGNTVYCTFNITLEGKLHCVPLKNLWRSEWRRIMGNNFNSYEILAEWSFSFTIIYNIFKGEVWSFVSRHGHFGCGSQRFDCIMLVFFRPWGRLNARHLYTVVLGCD